MIPSEKSSPEETSRTAGTTMSGLEGFFAGLVVTADIEERKAAEPGLSDAELNKLTEELIKRHEATLKMLAEH